MPEQNPSQDINVTVGDDAHLKAVAVGNDNQIITEATATNIVQAQNSTVTIVGGDIVAGNKTITQKISNFILGDRAQVDLRNRQIMLDRVRQFWIQGVLEKSLHHEMLLQLGKQEAADAVSHPWDMQIQEVAERPPHSFSQDQTMLAIFENLGRALLILGAPGSGKTITLLELARDAIVRAEDDPLQPIPVVLNLSSWAERQQNLAAWIVAELNLKYQIPKNVGQQWLEQNEILLLLDGLDEVAIEHRSACADALNQFRQEHGLSGIAVCSRLEEYHAMTTQLALDGALVLQPLQREQVSSYLAGRPELAALHTVLQEDLALQELAESPLMLNVMVLAYQGLPVEEVRSADSLAERRRRLFATYTERMLKRRSVETRYTPQQTLHWLSWLAGKMTQHSQTEFFLEGLQPTWLVNRTQRVMYAVGVRVCVSIGIVLLMLLATGLFYGLAAVDAWNLGGMHAGLTTIMNKPFGYTIPIERFGLFGLLVVAAFGLASVGILKLPKWLTLFGTVGCVAILVSCFNWTGSGGQINWARGISAGLLWGLPGGWLGASIRADGRITMAETLIWSWRKAFRGFCFGLIGEVGLALLFQFILRHNVSFARVQMVDILEGGLLLVLAWIIGFGVRGNELPDVRMVPGYGLRRSARNAIQVAFICLDATLVCLLLTSGNLRFGAALGILLGSLIGLVLGLAAGGMACLQHGILRFMLMRNGHLPRRVIAFLEYATERILLRKVGGGYMFPHRMLLEYFANLTETHVTKGGF